MQALVIVIPHVAPEREAQLALRREPRAVDQLRLQRMKERLHMRVVARGRPARGALPDAQDPEAIAQRPRGIPAASITVGDEAGWWAAAAAGDSRTPRDAAGTGGECAAAAAGPERRGHCSGVPATRSSRRG